MTEEECNTIKKWLNESPELSKDAIMEDENILHGKEMPFDSNQLGMQKSMFDALVAGFHSNKTKADWNY